MARVANCHVEFVEHFIIDIYNADNYYNHDPFWSKIKTPNKHSLGVGTRVVALYINP